MRIYVAILENNEVVAVNVTDEFYATAENEVIVGPENVVAVGSLFDGEHFYEKSA